jgi:cytochrome b561
MQLTNSPLRFGAVAQLLHWGIAALILVQYVLATLAADATLFQRLVLIARHKSFGITVLALAAMRLAWKLANPRVAPPAGQPRYQQRLATASHVLMYALLFALPVTGWLMSSAANAPVSYFGLLTLPDVLAPHESWVEPLEDIHHVLFDTLAAIVALHVAAALYHHFGARDQVLRRMLPGTRWQSLGRSVND